MRRNGLFSQLTRLLLLALALLLTCSAALAETWNLSSCTMDELLALRQQVDAAMLDLARTVDRSDATLDGLVWVSNGVEVRINAYEGTATEVVIPAEIDGLPVTMLHTGVFRDCKTVTRITLPDTITVIPDEAFSGCSNLVSVNIPRTVTHIGHWAFKDCNKLQTVTLPEGLVTLSSAAFQRAEGLSGMLVLPTTLTGLNGYTFSRCDDLSGIVIQSDLVLGDADMSCSSLELLYIREGAAVTFGSKSTFEAGLKVAIIPASVTSIHEDAFAACNKLVIVTPAGSYAEQYAREHWIVCNTQDYDQYVAEYEALLAQ
ncbi:MAG: leucine-rich repeat domain-containing protein [Clostridia bacterium]|nr:leucine-rich repeat domain-containing protein [Clostridia bacterium]